MMITDCQVPCISPYLSKRDEDTLTRVVVGNLLHLPWHMAWLILARSCTDSSLPLWCGSLKRVEFWPKWDASGTSNARYVEPDVFIETSDWDIIIEAKRLDGLQYSQQWEREVVGYTNEYGERNESGRPLMVVALGCDRAHRKTVIFGKIPVHGCTWSSIHDKCDALGHELLDHIDRVGDLGFTDDAIAAKMFILGEIVRSLEAFGLGAARIITLKDTQLGRISDMDYPGFMKSVNCIKGSLNHAC